VVFEEEEMSTAAILSLSEGGEVEIVVDPTVQITYKAAAASRPRDETLESFWQVQNPTTGGMSAQARSDAVNVPATLTVPARVVDTQGRTVVTYQNLPERSGFATSTTILHKDVAILYRVGGFTPNFLRGIMLILVQLSFLAALGVLAGSFVSFPVACLLCFSMLPFQVAREFLMDAITPLPGRGLRTGVLNYLNHYLVSAMNKLLPDFGRTFPGGSLVDGTYISPGFVGETFLWTFCLQTVLLLVIACLIFRKRELAKVQV
jgi:hypothetical protein